MADNTVEISVKLALEQFQAAANQLVTTFSGSMSKVEAEAAVAGGALDESFRVLGVKSVAQVEAEVRKLQVALGVVKAMPGVLPADAERATQAFNARLKELRGSLNAVPPAAGQVNAAVNETASALGRAARTAVAWTAALVGLTSVGDLAKNVIHTGSAFEQLEGRLKSLLGSQQAASAAFADIKQLAAETPFEVSALTEAFAKLTAFGMQPTMEQMRAFSDTAASLGGGTQMLERVTLALGQAWTKGKLQGQEIMQMAEAGVPVWDMLARVTGKNVGELQKLSEQGALGRDVIKALIDEMGRMNSGASATLMATFAGAVSNAKDATAEFFSLIAQSGVLEHLTQQIQGVLAEYERMKDTGELELKARAIADGFIGVANAVEGVIKLLVDYSGVLKLVLEAMVVAKVIAYGKAFAALGAAALGATGAMAAAGTAATATGAAAAQASVGVRLFSAALRSIPFVAAIAGLEWVISKIGEKFFSSGQEADKLKDKTAAALEAQPAPVAGAIDEVGRAAQRATVSLDGWNMRFDQLREKGESASAALKKLVADADLTHIAGVEQFAVGLQEIGNSARATGAIIETEIKQRLAGMTATELSTFRFMLQSTFDTGAISAATLATVMNETVDASLAKLGITAETSLGGMSAKFVETQQHALLVADSFDRIKEAGMDAGAVLKDALDATLKAASSKADLDALAQSVKALGQEGKLAKQDVADMLDAIAKKAEDATPAIDSVGEALRRLGVKSKAELQKVADSFKEAWTEVERGNVSLREKQDAFKAYAQAAIAANDGVASSFIQTRAASLGLTVEIDNAGKATIGLKQEADGLADGFKRAKQEAGEMSAEVQRGAKAAQDMTSEIRKIGSGTSGGVTSMPVDVRAAAAQQGITDKAGVEAFARAFSEEAMAMQERWMGKSTFSGLTNYVSEGTLYDVNYYNDKKDLAARAANTARMELDAEKARVAKGGAPTPRPQSVIHLTLPGGTSVPMYADAADANRLVRQLQQAGGVTYR